MRRYSLFVSRVFAMFKVVVPGAFAGVVVVCLTEGVRDTDFIPCPVVACAVGPLVKSTAPLVEP